MNQRSNFSPMPKMSRGFTLIELMIVVAIIGILASIAIPAYLNYTVRSQVTEGLNLAGPLKAAIAEHYAQRGEMPADFAAFADASPSGKYVDRFDWNGSALLIEYGGQSAEQLRDPAHNVLALAVGVTASGTLVWQCGHGPQSGGGTFVADADSLTTVEARYLPAACRG